MYEINLTPENHGYTIRLVKRTFENIEGKGSVEKSETISCLLMDSDHRQALAAFEILNTFIAVCAEKQIIPEDIFRHMPLKKY